MEDIDSTLGISLYLLSDTIKDKHFVRVPERVVCAKKDTRFKIHTHFFLYLTYNTTRKLHNCTFLVRTLNEARTTLSSSYRRENGVITLRNVAKNNVAKFFPTLYTIKFHQSVARRIIRAQCEDLKKNSRLRNFVFSKVSPYACRKIRGCRVGLRKMRLRVR